MKNAPFTRLLLLALLMLAIPAASFAGIFVSITVAPPPLPVYVQPVCPQAGYMWTPGYWAWADEGYYWVPGTWVPAPSVGVLWTPGYWGWNEGYYRWNAGYWGPHVGFYGGVNYGFGYGGEGFGGGEWRGGGFFYNRAVMNVDDRHVTNVYVNKTVIVNHTTINNVSYNGGTGGTRSAPTPVERQAAQERHIQPTQQQTQHESAASQNKQLLAKNNGGKPAIAATARPADFSPRSAVPARAAGGRVEPATLNASARTMPTAAKTAAVAPRAVAPARPSTPTATTRDNRSVPNHNVPQPPNASGRSSSPAAASTNHGANQAVPRPPAASASNRSYGNSGRPNPPPNDSRSQSQMHSDAPRPAPQPRVQAARPSAPVQQPRMQSQAPRPNQPAPQQHVQNQAPRPSQPAPQQHVQSQAPRPSQPAPQQHVQSQAPRPSQPARASAPPQHPEKEKGTPNERR